MASLRAKEAFDKAAQERRVAEQREVLRQRAAQRAKDRADERRHGGAFQPKQNINSSGGSRGDGTRGKRLPPKSGDPQGPQRTGASWGLAPTQWTGDVGGELVNLKSEVATLRAQRAKWEAERNAMESQLAKRRAELSEGAPSPPPGSVASPISVRNGEDIDPDAGPAVKENGRSVAFKATSGYNPADYDADYASMLTAEEEALRARTALMQREAELTAARAKERELMAALEQAKHGTDDLLESLPRATLPPAPTEPSSTPLMGSVNNAGTFDPLNLSGGSSKRGTSPQGTVEPRTVHIDELSPGTEAKVREIQVAARDHLARRSEEFATDALNASLRSEGGAGGWDMGFDATNMSSLTRSQRDGIEAMQAAARDHLLRSSGDFAVDQFGQASVRTIDVESDSDGASNLGDSFNLGGGGGPLLLTY